VIRDTLMVEAICGTYNLHKALCNLLRACSRMPNCNIAHYKDKIGTRKDDDERIVCPSVVRFMGAQNTRKHS
jgi:hypothetical protein